MRSASYINKVGSLEPDNWLVSKQLPLGGTMKVWLKGQDPDDFREHFAIYLSTEGNSKSDFLKNDGTLKEGVITLVPETETDNIYQEYTTDLSAYNGQEGYIAIRHFNCYGQYLLLLGDFSIYNEDAGGEWTATSGDSPTTIEDLTPGTEYEYQVEFQFNNNTFYTSTSTLTILAEDVAPTDLSVTDITTKTATVTWKGFGESYNLRYSEGGMAKVTLSVPGEVWGDGTGYQMLLDKDHDTYGTIIPETGGLTDDDDASDDTYAEFEYKIPTNADGDMDTDNVVNEHNSITITIPTGIYDWCITNPSPDDRIYIASANGNINGRQDDFVFEAGKHYTFTVTYDDEEGEDRMDMTVEDADELAPDDVTKITDIDGTSFDMSSLKANTEYTIYVQSVKGNKTSEWSRVNFTTLEAEKLNLCDDQDNSAIIANAAEQGGKWDVTLSGRTLWRDGDWNTLCLPFHMNSLTGTPLEGATLMELGNSDACNTGFDATTGTLNLDFVPAYCIEAGHAYIVKWETTGAPIENPVFKGVIMTTESPADQEVVSKDGTVTFVGNYNPVALTAGDNTNLYLEAGNQLSYPSDNMSINACRAHFQLNGITAGDPNSKASIRSFVLDFKEGESTEISAVLNDNGEMTNDKVWYTLDGRKLSGKPTTKGVYITNGKKVVVK